MRGARLEKVKVSGSTIRPPPDARACASIAASISLMLRIDAALPGFGIKQDCHPRHSGSDLFERLQPFAGKRILVGGEPSSVAPGARQAPNHASSDRIGKIREHDR